MDNEISQPSLFMKIKSFFPVKMDRQNFRSATLGYNISVIFDS